MPGPLWGSSALLLAVAGVLLAADPANVAELRRGFESPPDDARIMMRWWWFGPAVTKAELEREMRLMKQGGIGGFEIQPTYPLQLEGNLPYLSPEFLEMLRFTGEKARELGLRMDLTLGSGWPFGGPHIPIELASPRLRVAAKPDLREGESLLASFPERKQYFIASRTWQTVKRPAFKADGLVLDHYDRAAIERHLQVVGQPMLQALAKTPPYAIFSDSLEVYNSDWAPNFLAEFQKRRGYDLRPHLPALAGEPGEKSAAIRYDWGLTLSELCEENYLEPLRAWAKQHHTLLRSQTYGMPPVRLSSQRLVDLAEGEGTAWRRFTSTRWATSANHLYGRPVSSSETWTWLHSPVFRATPLDMKAEADIHFLQGVNQLVGHGWSYSPPEAGEPGWRFYAAAVFNRHNPWFMVMPDIAAYLQRVSWLLRQGEPVNDVAIYLPTADAMAGFALGTASVNKAMEGIIGATLVPTILDAGYGFDFTDDGAIAQLGITHKILIVPGAERMPLSTLRKIDEWATNGGIVLFTRRLPSKAPGLKEEGDAAAIQAIAAKHKLTQETRLPAAMHARLAPDYTVPADIGVVHRKLPFAEVYFLANTSNHSVVGKATFRVHGMEIAWWDPSTGKTSQASLDLNFAPYESRVLVFSKEGAPASPAASGVAPLDLSTDWKVAFPHAPVQTYATLHPWTDTLYSGAATYERSANVPDALARAPRVVLDFGEGTAADRKSEWRAPNGMRAWLESPMREAAQVFVNGKPAGAVWKAPFEVEVTGLLKPGENTIRVVVANLAINVLAKGPLPAYKELTARFGERFQPQDMQSVQPVPGGMMGPVRLMAR